MTRGYYICVVNQGLQGYQEKAYTFSYIQNPHSAVNALYAVATKQGKPIHPAYQCLHQGQPCRTSTRSAPWREQNNWVCLRGTWIPAPGKDPCRCYNRLLYYLLCCLS